MKIFAIELTSWCNARCSFCPYPTPQNTRQKGYMDHRTLHRICEIATEPKAVNLSGLGEPTLHRKLVDFVKILKDHEFRVQLNTNGQQLDQGLYDRLLRVKLDRLVITSDYFPWDKARLRTDPSLPVQFLTITREPDHPEMGQVRKPLDDWGGQVGKVNRPKVRCSYLYDDFVDIGWDGAIKRCHVDFNFNHPLGNVHTWKGETWAAQEIPLCAGCSGYVFKDGLTSGDYEGTGKTIPFAFQLGGG